MSTDTNAIRNYFTKLGLEPEIADLYLALNAYGPQTISELSRNAGVERTKIYRLIEALNQAHLVEVETHYKRSILRPAPITNLQILLSKKEQELKQLQDELTQVHRSLAPNTLSSPATRVQFYHGIEGLKQMFWNQTKTQTENIAILYENMQNRTNSAFFARWVRKMNEQKVQCRGIISDHFIATQQQWYAGHHNERLAYWQSRFISDDIFPITHSTITYDDVVAYYNWKDGEIFGIEIYNQEIADAQRQFFEILWKQGRTVRVKLGNQENTMP